MLLRVYYSMMLALFVPLAWADHPGVAMGDLSWPEAERRLVEAPIVIIPVAAGAKEHGPHLPMNADQVVMEYLLESAIAAQDVIVVPPILHGWFPAFRDFPGTEVSDPNVFQAYVYQVALSLAKHGANRLVFLNTGISNATGLPIAIAAREIRVQMGVPTLVVSWNDLETEASQEITEQSEGGHGDEIETSINLYLQPENVHMELAVQDYGNNPRTKMPGYQPGLFSRNTEDPAYSDTGIYGDPTLATAEKGERALNIMRNEWLSALRAFSAMPARARD